MKRLVFAMMAACLLCCATPAGAQTSSKNAMKEITSSIFYGGVAGLAVGGIILVANGGENVGEVLRWSFVTGAVVGLGYGIYQTSRGGDRYGLLNYQDGRLAWHAVMPDIGADGARVRVFAARF